MYLFVSLNKTLDETPGTLQIFVHNFSHIFQFFVVVTKVIHTKLSLLEIITWKIRIIVGVKKRRFLHKNNEFFVSFAMF